MSKSDSSYTTRMTSSNPKVKKKLSKAQMQLALIKKKKCDARALQIVEHLLETNINEQWLCDNLFHINQSHMEDIIHERAIIKLCGYILCNNSLTIVITQKYHISNITNKVYDVTLRKNFCSSRCYTAAKYILEQMLTSPLWLRNKEERPEFKLLPKDDTSKKYEPGEIVKVVDEKMLSNIDIINETANDLLSFNTEEECNDILKSNMKFYKNDNNKVGDFNYDQNCSDGNIAECNQTTNTNINVKIDAENTGEFLNNMKRESEEIEKQNNIHPAENEHINENLYLNTYKTMTDDLITQKEILQTNDFSHRKSAHKNINIESNMRREIERTKSHSRKESVKSVKYDSLIQHIEEKVKQWITSNTIKFLLDSEDQQKMIYETIQHVKIDQLCKKLKRLEVENEQEDNAISDNIRLKPLPELSDLQDDAKTLEFKVQSFYNSSFNVLNDISVHSESKTETDESNPIIPLTDAHDARVLRRRIFTSKINKVLTDLVRILSGNDKSLFGVQNLLDDEFRNILKTLINTFSLTSTNIIFKPTEWTLVGLIILKMLSMVNQKTKVLLESKQSSKYKTMILMSYKLDSNYLNSLLNEICLENK